MAEPAPDSQADDHLEALAEALRAGTLKQARGIVSALHPAEIAHLLESLPPSQRRIVWEMVDQDDHGEVLLHVGDEVRAGLIDAMDHEALLSATEGLDVDDLADLLQDLPDAVARQALAGMDQQYRQRLEAVLSYAEDTAGGLMNTDTVTVRANVSLDVVLRYLRMKSDLPELIDSLIVVNRYDRYLGILPLSTVVTRDPAMTVAEVMNYSVEGISAQTSAAHVAKIFEDRDLVSAPVVDEQGKLVGRITIDDVVDVIREEAEHSVMSMAGLTEEEDIFAPIIPSVRRRALWLGVNLITAFLAASVVGQFQGTIEKVVALAVLMPIVASMGGIAGNQILALVIRGLAQGQISKRNARFLAAKELAVGACNGVIFALLVGAVAVAWFRDWRIGALIATAMIINLLCAAMAGVGIPLLLRRFGIDPALAAPVVVTTVTDVMGFFAFLGLATLVLL
ncbi:MAG: magnesium transporter [Gammaproteobacteria bacterium]|nr:magnesium transporter [Gammaproteobacteria bacterium]